MQGYNSLQRFDIPVIQWTASSLLKTVLAVPLIFASVIRFLCLIATVLFSVRCFLLVESCTENLTNQMQGNLLEKTTFFTVYVLVRHTFFSNSSLAFVTTSSLALRTTHAVVYFSNNDAYSSMYMLVWFSSLLHLSTISLAISWFAVSIFCPKVVFSDDREVSYLYNFSRLQLYCNAK